MNFFETGLLGDGGCCMFVERAKVSRNVKLFVNAQLLISEDCRQVSASLE